MAIFALNSNPIPQVKASIVKGMRLGVLATTDITAQVQSTLIDTHWY